MESRSCPCFPTALVNFSAGLTRLRFRDMGVGHARGRRARRCSPTPPSAAASTDLGSPEAVIAIALLVTLGLVGALLVRRQLAAGAA